MKNLLLTLLFAVVAMSSMAQEPFVTTTIENGEFAENTKWYVMRIGSAKKVIKDNAGAEFISLQTTGITGNDDELWCFVGNSTDGYAIYNKQAGVGKVLASDIVMNTPSSSDGGATYPTMQPAGALPENYVGRWSFSKSYAISGEEGYFMKLYGTDYAVNDYASNGVLTFWTGGFDAGSTIIFKEFSAENAISNTILRSGSLDVKWENDSIYPWTIDTDVVKNGNVGVRNSTSTLSFSYSSEMRTEVTFDWACYNYSSHSLKLYVDGVYMASTTNSSYKTQRFYLDAGSHIITLQDTIGNNTYTQNWSGIKNVRVKNIQPLEEYVLTEKSEPITFVNDGVWPWTQNDGYILNSNYGTAYSASEFSTAFSIDETSKFSFDLWVNDYQNNNWTGEHYFTMYINGESYKNINYNSGWNKVCVALEPGDYTVVFRDTIYNTTTYYYSRVKNVELSSDWLVAELSTAGSLGVEVLYQVNVLNDVELLKVKGNLNSTDWTSIYNMKNIVALDLSEAKFNAVPSYAFDGLSRLSKVYLPDGVKSIGEYAFRGTQILDIDIPSSVTSIGQYAFAETRVRSVDFKDDSNLQTIAYRAFYNCKSLKEFIMPNTVTKLGTYNNYVDYECNTFYECTSLKKIHFSNSLTKLEGYVCYGCSNLVDVVLPQNLQYIHDYAFYNNNKLRHIDFPETLLGIDYGAFLNCGLDSVKLPLKLSYMERYAFQNCNNLKYIELPSYIGSYDNNFYNCDAIEKVVCRSATPPSISTDPFREGRAKSAITLVVPSFAVVNYKLDTYWCQFGSIVEGENLDYWKITSALSLTNNRRMDGKPDIDLFDGGKLTVGGAAPMETGQFNYYPYVPNPASLLNDCQSMTADSVNTYYWIDDANKWYFFTPVHDVDVSKIIVSNDASYVIRYYDGESRAANGTGNSWRNVDSDKLLAGLGYIFHCNKSCMLTLPCEAENHQQLFVTTDVTKQLSVYESTASANKSWNYVGNPYPSYYDIYYMDFTAPITVWTGSTYKAYSIADDNFVLAPMQSFFVQKPDEIDNIVFHKEGRQHTSSIERPSYTKARAKSAGTVARHFFDLQIMNDDEIVDETRIVMNETALLDYELNLDASKFMSINENAPQIFSFDADGNSYAINERPVADGNVNIGYYVAESGYYTISAVRADGDVYLHDNKTDKTVDLTVQDYYFYSDPTDEADCSRFTLSLNVDNSGTTGVAAAGGESVVVAGDDDCIRIISGKSTSLQVFAADGRCVCEKSVEGGVSYINVSKGIYIVKINGSTFKTIVF